MSSVSGAALRRRARSPSRCRGRASASACPEVTSPPPSIGMPCRGTAFSSITNATSRRAGPSALTRRSSSTPGELLVERAGPAEAGRDRVRVGRDVVAVQRVADLEAERVAGAEPARRRAAAERPHPRARPRPRPGTSARRPPRPCSRCGRPCTSMPSTSPIACVNGRRSGRPSCAIERGPCTASSAYSSETSRTSEPRLSRSFSQAYAGSRFDALTTSRKRAAVEPVGDQVVDDPAALVRQQRVLGSPSSTPVEVVREQALQQLARASGPRRGSGPCARRRRRPQSVRTARCSGITPSYCTGISQPANGTMRAPARDVALVQRRAQERLHARDSNRSRQSRSAARIGDA